MLRVFGLVLEVLGMGSGLVVLDAERLEKICVQHGCQSCRRCASRSALRFGNDCIGRLLVPLGHIAILLLCWLDSFGQRLGQLFLDRKARKSGSFGVLGCVRSGFLRFVVAVRRRGGCGRIAVGLAPLGRTSSGW